jgi:hypothetical protein
MLDVMCICKLSEKISSTFFKYCKNLLLTPPQIEPQHTNPDSQHNGTAVRNALPAVMQNGLNESGKLSDNIMSLYYTILVFA